VNTAARPDTQIRLLTPADAQELFELRRLALAESPFSFSASPEDDRIASVSAAARMLDRAPASVVIGAFEERLTGMLDVYRQEPLKTAHIAVIWGVFVRPSSRGQGIAALLLDAGIAHARGLEGVTSVRLSVNETTPGARRLYERFGFKVWGVEPDGLRFEGRSTSELHMSLSLLSERPDQSHNSVLRAGSGS
jgi:ribosomal protein S18 acetylase RimI-like enzyme